MTSGGADSRRGSLRQCRRASVAIYVALMAPVLAAAVALGVEVTSWASAQQGLQEIADASAQEGALYCLWNVAQNNTCTNSTTVAQTAATLAAKLAETNGATGGSSPSWSATSKTYSDNNITAKLVSGVRSASDAAIQVSVTRTVPLTISQLFDSQSGVTLTATSTGEVVTASNSSAGGQPCLLTLSGDGDGTQVGTPDITLTGNIDINAPTCTLRSDRGISASGSVSITANALYAASTITTNGNAVSITGAEHPYAGQISDPYANNTALQNALNTANNATGGAISCSGSSCSGPTGWGSCTTTACTINPGTYTGLDDSAKIALVLSPGLYTINGDISFSGKGSITGSGVTILLGNGYSFSTTGSGTITLSAATTAGATNSQIPGIVFATQSSQDVSLGGSAGLAFTGVLYAPNAALAIAGNSTSGDTGCAEVIVATAKFSGSANFASNCSSYGTATFGSVTSWIASLVR